MALESLCTLSHAGKSYLCHTGPAAQGAGALQIYVTDGADVWRADVSEEALQEWNTSSSRTSQLNGSEKLREIFQLSVPVLEVQGSLARLTIALDPGSVTPELFKLPIAEARSHLQALLFSLADQVSDLEKRLTAAEGRASASSSPIKAMQNHQLLIPDVDARKRGYGISASQVKRRLPGESLINPGCKSKKKAKGVAFEDA